MSNILVTGANRQLGSEIKEKSYWSDIIRFRETISHHYIDINSEIVFDILNEDIKELKKIVSKRDQSLGDEYESK